MFNNFAFNKIDHEQQNLYTNEQEDYDNINKKEMSVVADINIPRELSTEQWTVRRRSSLSSVDEFKKRLI